MHINNFKKFYFIDEFDKDHLKNLNKNTALIYRNYKVKHKEKLINEIKKFCKTKKINFYLSNNVKLAIKLDLDGVYIPSFNSSFKHLNYNFKKKFVIAGSAHNLKEIKIKEKQMVKKIFLSSLFKKNNNYLGINKFKVISKYTKKKVVALGGISKKNIRKLKLLSNQQFAGISYFG